MDLPEDVVRFVERSFSAVDRAEALDLLRGASLGDSRESAARLLRCAVISAHRDLGRLRKQIALIAIDYRDIILEGEYIVRDGKLVRARNLNDPIPEDSQ